MQKQVEKLPPLDGGWGWFCVLGCALTLALFGSLGKSVGIFYVAMLDRFGGSATATAWIWTIAFLLWGGLSPVVAMLCTRFSCRLVTSVGGVLISVGLLGTAFAPNLIVAYITFGCFIGTGLAGMYTASYIIISDYFKEKKGIANGIATVGSGIGSFCFPPLLQWLIDSYGFQGMCIIMSAAMLNTCVGGALYRPLNSRHYRCKTPRGTPREDCQESRQDYSPVSQEETERKESQPEKGADDGVPVTCSGELPEKENGRTVEIVPEKTTPKKPPIFNFTLMRNPEFVMFLVMTFAIMSAVSVSVSFITAMAEEHGITPEKSAFLLSGFGIGEIVSRPVFGFVFDLAFLRRRRVNLYCLVTMTFGAAIGLMGVVAWSYGLLLGMCVLRGLAGGTAFAQRTTFLEDLVGADRVAMGFGLMMLCSTVAMVIGQQTGGLVKDYAGVYNLTFIIFGSISVTATLVFMVFHACRERRRCGKEANKSLSIEVNVL